MLSRSPTASLINIVGQRDDAIERLWNVITHRTQWTEYVDTLLDAWSVEGDGIADERTSKNVFDMASEFPFKVCNITIPNSNSGFVYLLVSTVCSDRTYTGQTKNLAIRLVRHNSGKFISFNDLELECGVDDSASNINSVFNAIRLWITGNSPNSLLAIRTCSLLDKHGPHE